MNYFLLEVYVDDVYKGTYCSLSETKKDALTDIKSSCPFPDYAVRVKHLRQHGWSGLAPWLEFDEDQIEEPTLYDEFQEMDLLLDKE